MGNLLIDKRIQKMEMVKASLLKVKKEHRHTTLQEVNGIIARLKRWNIELEEQKQLKEKQHNSKFTGNYYKELTEEMKQKTEVNRTTL